MVKYNRPSSTTVWNVGTVYGPLTIPASGASALAVTIMRFFTRSSSATGSSGGRSSGSSTPTE